MGLCRFRNRIVLASTPWDLSVQETCEPISQPVTPLSDLGRLHYLSRALSSLPAFATLLQQTVLPESNDLGGR